MPDIDEIVVVGRKRSDRSTDPPGAPPGGNPGPGGSGSGGSGHAQPPGRGTRSFVPPVLPQVIEEIVVTATRPATTVFGTGSATGAFNIGAMFAVVGGFVMAGILDRLGTQKLNRALRESDPIDKPPKDTPVQTLPEVIPNITVIGRTPLVVPPLPIIISPDMDPFRMLPIEPVRFPAQPAPATPAPAEIAPPVLPEIQPGTFPTTLPQTLPGVAPSRFPLPIALPFATPSRERLTQPQPAALPLPNVSPFPQTYPSTQPFPSTQPAVMPFGATLPSGQPATQTGVSALPMPMPMPMPQGNLAGQCPPCPKCNDTEEEEKPRDQCYKKLVKEGVLPSLDSEYNWTEIDCVTGREL